jgi:hypothetical protein
MFGSTFFKGGKEYVWLHLLKVEKSMFGSTFFKGGIT